MRLQLVTCLSIAFISPGRTVAQDYDPDVVASHLEAASESGDPRRGLAVFTNAKSACVSCHKVAGQGGDVGPDLTEIAKLRKPDQLIESLLWPNRTVEDKYRAVQVVTEDGKQLRGYVMKREEKSLTIIDPTDPRAKPQTIPIDSIEDESPVGSLMPTNLLATMSDQQRADLTRFLMSLGTDNGIPRKELNMLIMHATAHGRGPATFEHDRKPLQPEHYPHWQHFVNRDRDYDFYAKQAAHFRGMKHPPMLLGEFPGLDGGQQGHWGNQNDQTTWKSDRWNQVKLGSMQAGIFHGPGGKIGRAVCVRFGEKGKQAACFNADSLRFEAHWSGDKFLRFSDHRHGFLNGLTPVGEQHGIEKTKPITEPTQYHGFYRIGERVIFAYRVGEAEHLVEAAVEDGKLVQRRLKASKDQLVDEIVNAEVAWPEVFRTRIRLGKAVPYAVDTIELPTDNPWDVPLFVGGLGFSQKSILVCTMHGDVWFALNYQHPSKEATWKRFASGLHHPLGMVIDKDGIFVLCRDQITRLHDLNDDGEADFYECFSNAFVTSTAGHDYICGLQRDAEGRFYIASGNQGIVRISRDGQKADVIATGFRNPDGLGLLPDGTVTVPCSEGAWTPASMICAARPSSTPSFHGYRGPKNGQPPTLPLAYLPRGLDNSAGGQCIVESHRWGPLKDQLIHTSFGTGRHMLVLRDEVDGQLQGAVVPLPGEFLSGAHRARFSPRDGQLYVGGMQGWGSYTPEFGCLHRVRYTGDPVQLPTSFRVHENGVAIGFADDIDTKLASKPESHFAQCWNYRYSAAYGSPEFSTTHFGMQGHDRMDITNAHVSDDRRTLFLEIPDVQPVNQLHLLVKSNEQDEHQLFVTAHKLAPPFRDYPGYRAREKTINPHPILADIALTQRKQDANPHIKRINKARPIRIETGTNLSYRTREFKVKQGEAIALTLVNPDVVPHNLVLAKPGSMERIGDLANKFISDPNAAVRQYVPDSPDVLAYTDVVFPKSEFTIYFKAPKKAGRYPYLCTFPGHWMIMNGTMVVE